MKTDNGHNGKSPRRRGNVLVLAILMTMLLFILGIAFLSTTMIEKSTVASLGNEEYLDSGVQIVVERINEVLVDDLFQGTNYDAAVLNNPERLYDYPDDNNFWLASLEPEFDDGSFTGYPPHYFWRHITDLWRRFNDPQTPGPGNPEIRWYDPDEKDEATGAYVQQVRQDGPYGDLFKVSGHHVPIRIVAEDEPINVFFSGGVPVYHGPVLDGIDPRPSGWPTNPPPDPYKIDGMRADADGDGVVDARWVRLGRQGPKGEYLWAAVRIVDNGGKININTAFRNPEHPVEGADPGINPRRWDGSRLSHVDLIGIRAVGDDGIPVAAIEGHRYGSVAFDPADYLNDTQYEMEVARRILNPFRPGIGLEYQPFGKTDELDLANRYLLRSPMTNAGSFPSQLWPVTFNPPPGQVGKQYPYTQDMPINPSSFDIAPARPLNAWYDHVTPDGDVPGFYNRRHLFTTYSFDRILRPESVDPLDSITRCEDLPGQRKVALLLPNEGSGNGIGDGQFSGFADAASRDEYWEVLVGALYRGLPANNTNRVQDRFGNNTNFGYDREKLARCWALNLIDLQDTDIDIIATPPVDNDKPTVQTVGDTTYYGLESLDILQRHTLFISKLGYVEIDPNQPGTCPMGKYYAIELFNPDGRPNTAQALSTYEIRVMDRSDNLKFSLDLGSLTTVVQ
ncbi:MAG: hypothetical protein JW810_06525, partial [Sedimentisphaerales bacterium]|nr:hypothetical protein [Sedimentisphaerales bacterium]